ncbi:hypothetical protein XFF6166_840046 [Xanthomonas citri pv. fuscans]|uniref:Uncharacterized protein n=1 Tax=Xanthomonas campestris pv. phaseoli TaxID=317013 RepID=A0AB38E1P0_XANCH|nr:hypothetical protein XAP6984_390018 [Xanthomonas phaseoli pv. phaseoli]SON87749.1 hypothetical protein XFF6166_840046 [Xanthomonas citri pv. fuscans]SON84269.1 hypothetical protein XAP412_330018 [Xanthomonas phaseoli pv. phaseoli]SON88647.1 hypothetical protein XAP7430_380018 [Xanthomonas phaseoli pv. phaseoli]SON98387.1 hypothetical protein XFF7767_1030045 [Xanthomonas citri pv. fuscans]
MFHIRNFHVLGEKDDEVEVDVHHGGSDRHVPGRLGRRCRKPLYQTGPALSRSATATAAAEPSLQRLLSAPSTANAQVVQLDAGAVTASEKLLELQLDGQAITATQAKVDALEDGDSVWYGNLGPRAGTRARTLSGVDPLNSAILVRSGDTVTGTIRYAGKLYRLRPLADGRHVLVQVDEQRMPQEHPADYSLLPKFDMPGDGRVTAAAASSGSPATIRVLVVATNKAVTAYGGNMQSLVQLAVAEANQATSTAMSASPCSWRATRPSATPRPATSRPTCSVSA